MTISQAELKQLQETMLKAAIFGLDLPESGLKIKLPDLEFVIQDDTVHLLDENLVALISLEFSGRRLETISLASLKSSRRNAQSTSYLRFLPARVDGDTVGLTLEARLLQSEPAGEMGLSSVHVTFVRSGSAWVAQSPYYSAN